LLVSAYCSLAFFVKFTTVFYIAITATNIQVCTDIYLVHLLFSAYYSLCFVREIYYNFLHCRCLLMLHLYVLLNFTLQSRRLIPCAKINILFVSYIYICILI